MKTTTIEIRIYEEINVEDFLTLNNDIDQLLDEYDITHAFITSKDQEEEC